MTPETAKYIRDRFEQTRNDDLERAEAAFRGLPPHLMQGQYGESGKTRQQILDEYRAERRVFERALSDLDDLFSTMKVTT